MTDRFCYLHLAYFLGHRGILQQKIGILAAMHILRTIKSFKETKDLCLYKKVRCFGAKLAYFELSPPPYVFW